MRRKRFWGILIYCGGCSSAWLKCTLLGGLCDGTRDLVVVWSKKLVSK
jgi:hypothetical protein